MLQLSGYDRWAFTNSRLGRLCCAADIPFVYYALPKNLKIERVFVLPTLMGCDDAFLHVLVNGSSLQVSVF